MEKLKDSLKGPRVPAMSLAVIVMDWPTGRVPPDGSNVNLLPNGVVLGSRPKVASMDPLQASNDQVKLAKWPARYVSVFAQVLCLQGAVRAAANNLIRSMSMRYAQLSPNEVVEYCKSLLHMPQLKA